MSDLNIAITSEDDMRIVITDAQNTSISSVKINEVSSPNIGSLVGLSVNQPESDDTLFYDLSTNLWRNTRANSNQSPNSPVDGGEFF